VYLEDKYYRSKIKSQVCPIFRKKSTKNPSWFINGTKYKSVHPSLRRSTHFLVDGHLVPNHGE
jgi:hypothetical protein